MKKVFVLFVFLFSLLIQAKEIKIVFVGDSLTAGYGVEKHFAFPSLIEKKLKEKKYQVKVINGGVSGSTTANGQARMKWFFKSNPDLMVIALGANDGLRGVKIDDSYKNLDESIKMALAKKVKVILMGMQMPPNYGKTYRKEFKEMFPKLAKANKISLVPFMLEGIAGEKKYNIEDGIHPNEKGHEMMTNLILPFVEKELKKIQKVSNDKNQ